VEGRRRGGGRLRGGGRNERSHFVRMLSAKPAREGSVTSVCSLLLLVLFPIVDVSTWLLLLLVRIHTFFSLPSSVLLLAKKAHAPTHLKRTGLLKTKRGLCSYKLSYQSTHPSMQSSLSFFLLSFSLVVRYSPPSFVIHLYTSTCIPPTPSLPPSLPPSLLRSTLCPRLEAAGPCESYHRPRRCKKKGSCRQPCGLKERGREERVRVGEKEAGRCGHKVIGGRGGGLQTEDEEGRNAKSK